MKIKPKAYLFEGKLMTLEQIQGKTFSDSNAPIELFTRDQIKTEVLNEVIELVDRKTMITESISSAQLDYCWKQYLKITLQSMLPKEES
jgi:hypothetical protein